MIASLQAKRILKKSEISRSRFILDAALMIMWRQLHKAAMESAGGCVWYFMTDSSPQFGRDYQVTRVRRILRRDLGRLLAASEELYFLWRQDGRLPWIIRKPVKTERRCVRDQVSIEPTALRVCSAKNKKRMFVLCFFLLLFLVWFLFICFF